MNSKAKIFIDGNHGTTGLELENRLKNRDDIEILYIDPEKRKDPSEKQKFFDKSDVIFLCLPDEQAIKSVSMIHPEKIVIDASTAHRTNPDWTYGFPELNREQPDRIAASKRIAVPGCHASGFIALLSPLIQEGLIKPEASLSCFSITGYSGGGKEMIEEYEADNRNIGDRLGAPMAYSLSLNHKHLPEMKLFSGLKNEPYFLPIVGDMKRGMMVVVPLHGSLLENTTMKQIWNTFDNYYNPFDTPFIYNKSLNIHYRPDTDNIKSDLFKFLEPTYLNHTNDMAIYTFGNGEHVSLVAIFDNLGKGSSGAAVQCMNIALGIDQETGLEHR